MMFVVQAVAMPVIVCHHIIVNSGGRSLNGSTLILFIFLRSLGGGPNPATAIRRVATTQKRT